MQGIFRTAVAGKWRFGAKKVVQFALKRYLTTAETAIALRPFYFAVHPDLFGQHPQARAVNEDSLKKLSEYLENVHSKKRSAPQSLLFYVRDTDTETTLRSNAGHFRTVRISLLSLSPRETVTSVLRACNLPLDYVDSVQQPVNTNRSVLWNEDYVQARDGIPNPEHEKPAPVIVDTLSLWLQKNLNKAKEKQSVHEPIRKQAELLRLKLIKETGVNDIRWASGWGVKPFRACLRSFSRLYHNHANDIKLEGYTLVFGNETGVCVRGNAILRHDDVPDNWLPLLRSLPKHQVTLHKLPTAERHLSSLLNDIIVKPCNTIVLAQTYLAQLRRLSRAIKVYSLSQPDHVLHYQSLEDVNLVMDCSQGPLHLTTSGDILVPSSCAVFLLIDFINKHADEARNRAQSYYSERETMKKFVKDVSENLKLESLTCDPNITCDQLTHCLERLLVEPDLSDLDLSGCRVKVAQFYSVMSDGEIYIPWNWHSRFSHQSKHKCYE